MWSPLARLGGSPAAGEEGSGERGAEGGEDGAEEEAAGAGGGAGGAEEAEAEGEQRAGGTAAGAALSGPGPAELWAGTPEAEPRGRRPSRDSGAAAGWGADGRPSPVVQVAGEAVDPLPGPSGRPLGVPRRSDSSSSFSEFSDTSSTVSSLAPVSTERTDLLLRFFRSDFFDEWIAISYLYTCHQDGVCDYLCNRLYGIEVERWERYLAQLCVILVMRPLPALERFIVDSCAGCIRIAVKVYWLLTAWMDDKSERDPQFVVLKRVRAACLESALNGGWEPPFKEHLISSHRAAKALSHQGSGLLAVGADGGDGEERGAFDQKSATTSAEHPGAGLGNVVSESKSDVESDSEGEDAFAAEDGPDAAFGTVPETPPRPGAVPPLPLHEIRTPSPTVSGDGDVFSPLTSPKMRRNTFAATLDLIDALCEASARLAVIPQGEERREELRQMLSEINEALGSPEAAGSACLYPLGDGNERVLHIPPQEAILLNSKDRAPFMLFLEVLEERPASKLGGGGNGDGGGCGGGEDGAAFGSDQGGRKSLDPPPASSALNAYGEMGAALPPALRSAQDPRQRRVSLEDQPISEAINTAMANLSVDSATLREKATTPKKGTVGGLLDSLYEGVRARSRSSSVVTDSATPAAIDQTAGGAGETGARCAPGSQGTSDATPPGSPEKPPHEDRLPLPQRRGKGHARVPSADAIQAMYLKYNRGGIPGVEDLIEGIEAAQQAADEGSHHSVEAEARQEEALKVYGEKFLDKQKRVRASSPYGHLPGWKLQSVIVKAGDDCRQELMALQLLKQFKNIFMESGLPLYIRDYSVLVTSSESGLIETVVDSLSIHTIKSNSGTSLRQHFEDKFVLGSREFLQAQRNLVESMAAYSVVCYLLQVKDRHNSNILIDQEGRLIHIDFGFMLSNSPGGINFETAPFKLTREILEVMDSDAEGTPSELFDYYKVLVIQGFLACRKHSEQITVLIDIMHKSGFPCFKAGRRALAALKKRFCLNKTEEQCVEHVLDLLSESLDAWRTRQYDYFQRVSNGIL